MRGWEGDSGKVCDEAGAEESLCRAKDCGIGAWRRTDGLAATGVCTKNEALPSLCSQVARKNGSDGKAYLWKVNAEGTHVHAV